MRLRSSARHHRVPCSTKSKQSQPSKLHPSGARRATGILYRYNEPSAYFRPWFLLVVTVTVTVLSFYSFVIDDVREMYTGRVELSLEALGQLLGKLNYS